VLLECVLCDVCIILIRVCFSFSVMPGMMMILLFLTTSSYYLADGPLFPHKIDDYENCRVNWWLDLLMVFNLARTSDHVSEIALSDAY
jgi:hypothetical protein